MISNLLRTAATAVLVLGTAAAQNPDSSANNTLMGDYFVREVQMTGTVEGTVTAASSVIGVATFNGNGQYTFTGQGTSLAAGPNSSLSLSGLYSVGSNGLFQMTCLADQSDIDYGGVSAVGPTAFVASATEGSNVTMLIGIKAGSNVSNGSFTGNYVAGAIDFPSANINMVRQATFALTPSGTGNLGNVAVSGVGADLGGNALSQTDSGVTYSLTGEGSGNINFGAAANSQLVSGSKTFYISADGNVVLGGSPTGYDMLVGIRSLSSTASDATANSEYYMAAFEDSVDPTGQTTNQIDAFYGSDNATGTGISLYHNRITSLIYSVYDFTFDSEYSVLGNGTVPVGDSPYSFIYGVNGQAFIATGDAAGSSFYSLALGFALPTFSGNGVYIKPDGIVSAATFSPVTNPIAPGEWIAIVGTGFASPGTAASASAFPLPHNLGGATVTMNGTAIPLNYVSPTEIVGLVPIAISPDNGVDYATVQVMNNSGTSNNVTVYTRDTAPGVFTNPPAIGAALAEHTNYALISASSPANIGETINIYANGLGAVTPPVADGAPAPSSPLSTVNDLNLFVDFGGEAAENPLPFAGLTPTLAGLYQIQVPVPVNTPPLPSVDISTTDGYTAQAIMSVSGGASEAARAQLKQKRLPQNRNRPRKDQQKTIRAR